MNRESFSLFRKFQSKIEALDLQKLLSTNDINSQIVDNIPVVDITFSNNTSMHVYEVLIDRMNFDKAESLLLSQSEETLQDVDESYFLFDFTNEELVDVIVKKDEWNEYNYLLAKKILSGRGVQIDSNSISELQKERFDQQAKPEKSNKIWLIAGYIFALLGGFIGIIIGYSIWQSKKNLSNGTTVFVYTQNDRKHGQQIFYLGTIILIIYVIFKFI